MDGLIIGYDLCNDYGQISCYVPGEASQQPEGLNLGDGAFPELMPVAVCKKRGEDTWLIGEEAFRTALMSNGIMVDKLMKQVCRRGMATIEGKKYSAQDLLFIFLEETIKVVLEKKNAEKVGSIVFTIQTLDPVIMDTLIFCTDKLGLSRDQVFIISHTESFLYYAISQTKELWVNQVALFDLSDEGLYYYELDMKRGVSPKVVVVENAKLEEGFSLDILDTPAGERMADSILASCAKRLLVARKKVFSSVYLSGKGFDRCQEWAGDFLKVILDNKRRVFATESIFAKGAVYAGIDYTRATTLYPYTFICEGRLTASVYMNVLYNGTKHKLVLGAAGDNWYETRSTIELIPDDTDQLEFTVKYVEGVGKGENKIFVPLEGIPNRPNKTTRLLVTTAFTSENTMLLRVEDRGFGDLFASNGWVFKEEVTL